MTAINAPGLPDALPSILAASTGTAATDAPADAAPASTPTDEQEAGE